MNKNANFVCTTDESTKDILLKEGFQLVDSNNGRYTFLNCQKSKLNFDNKKVIYTDKLCI